MKKLLLLLSTVLVMSWDVKAQNADAIYSLNNTFKTVKLNSTFDGMILNQWVQPDGKVIVKGLFGKISGTFYKREIARLNKDGSLDNTFANNLSAEDMVILPDNKILATNIYIYDSNNNSTYYRAAILNSDGTFNKSIINAGTIIGTPVLGTDKSSFYVSVLSNSYVTVQKFSVNGIPDYSFGSPSLDYYKTSTFVVKESSDKRLFVLYAKKTGGFAPVIKLVRLETSGSQDAKFSFTELTIGVSSPSLSMAVMDKKVIIQVEDIQSSGTTDLKKYNGILRVNDDGNIDAAFNISDYADNYTTVYKHKNFLLLRTEKKLFYFGDNTKNVPTNDYKLGSFVGSKITFDANEGFFVNGRLDNIAPYNRFYNLARFDANFNTDNTFVPNINDLNRITTYVGADGKITIASHDNSFYVEGNSTLESFDRTIRLNKDGSTDKNFLRGKDKLGKVTFTNDGSILFTDSFYANEYKTYVTEYTPNGNFNKVVIEKSPLQAVNSAVATDSSIWVATSFPSNILRFTKDGVSTPLSLKSLEGSTVFLTGNILNIFNDKKGNIRVLISDNAKYYANVGNLNSLFIYTFNVKGILEKKVETSILIDDVGSSNPLLPSTPYTETIELFGNIYAVQNNKTVAYRNQPICMDYEGNVLANCGTKLKLATGDASKTQIINIFPDGNLLALVNNEEIIKLSPDRVQPKSQTIDFDLITTKTTSSPAFTLTAKASSGLPITYKVITGPIKIAGNTVTLNGVVGSVEIQATQNGNGEFSPATAISRFFNIELSTQTISFDAITAKSVLDKTVTLSAKSTSGLPITFLVVSGPAKIAGNTLTLDGIGGTVVVRASQAGDVTYAPAKTVDQSFKVELASQTITFDPIAEKFNNATPFQVVAKASSSLPVNLSLVSGPAKLDGSTVTLNGTAGIVVIKGLQAGTNQYISTEANLSINVILLLATEQEDIDVQIYPNPASNYLTMKVSKSTHNLRASLITMNGVEITSNDVYNTNEITLNISTTPAGNYLLRLNMNGEILNHKVLIFK